MARTTDAGHRSHAKPSAVAVVLLAIAWAALTHRVLDHLRGFALWCLLLLLLGLRARRRPEVADLAFLIIWGFLVTGSVHNPQYGLWILPLALMSTARSRDIAIWQAGELVFFVGIMWHIGGVTPPPEGPDKIYVATVALRLLAGGWLALQLIRNLTSGRTPPQRQP